MIQQYINASHVVDFIRVSREWNRSFVPIRVKAGKFVGGFFSAC
jgi:hypothetical protein